MKNPSYLVTDTERVDRILLTASVNTQLEIEPCEKNLGASPSKV